MAIERIASATGATPTPALETGKEKFGRALGDAQRNQAPVSETTPLMIQHAAPAHASAPVKAAARPPGRPTVPMGPRVDAFHQMAHGIDRVTAAQRRLEHVLRLAESGKTFTPAELLALQAQVYQAGNEIDLAGKVVDKATGGVKQVLQTQV
jgi:hypothetical protein